MLYRSECAFTCQLLHILGYSVLVQELGLVEPSCFILRAEYEQESRIYNSLTLEYIMKVFIRYVNICKYVKVRSPASLCSGLTAFARLFAKSAYIVSLLKMECILITVTHYLDIHELG